MTKSKAILFGGTVTSYIRGLRCKECSARYAATKISVCEKCFGPLEVEYDLAALRGGVSKDKISGREKTLWRYIELLPVAGPEKIVDLQPGFTPLRRAKNLGEKLGLTNVWVKDDTVNPTYSFKDRPVAVAVAKAIEWNMDAVGCASTGNLAAATSAAAAKAQLPCYVFAPASLESTKLLAPRLYGATLVPVYGTYDDANRIALLFADRNNWGFVNINMRPYYAEGSKTLIYETCEQLGWQAPDLVLVPLGSGLLLTAVKKGLTELADLGFVRNGHTRISGSQPEGCTPIVDGFNSPSGLVKPVKQPSSIAESLAIGDPASGYEAISIIKKTGGFADAPTSKEVIEAQKLLARTEGVFAEPAGGTVVASLKRRVEKGEVDKSEKVVLLVTGNGLKTPSVLLSSFAPPTPLKPDVKVIENYLRSVSKW